MNTSLQDGEISRSKMFNSLCNCVFEMFSYFRNELPETFETEVDGLADLERNQRSFRSCK